MKRIFLVAFTALSVSISTFAGGLLTNTNQSASFLRNFAQGASIDVTGAYYNPAGLSFLPDDGFYLSINAQSAYQTRNINATFNRYNNVKFDDNNNIIGFNQETFNKKYKGTASAPIVPSFQSAYKKGNWVLSASFAIGGGGGKASFDKGLPMFDSQVMAGIATNPTLGKYGLNSPDIFNINSSMIGRQYIYNLQGGLSYKVNNWLSVYGGLRMNYLSGSYEGFITATPKDSYSQNLGKDPIVSMNLDCTQSGWGIQPIIGFDTKFNKINIAAKYELMANLNIENDTKSNTTGSSSYEDGVNTPNDIPALLMLAGSYEITPKLRASVEYHYFFDKNAGMADVTVMGSNGEPLKHGKQNELTHGTIEWLGGVEYDIFDKLTLSCSYQNTNYGLSDNYQTDTSFSCDSYSLGIGAKIKISSKSSINLGYMWTNYSDYTKSSNNYNGTKQIGSDTYSRTNKVFGAGIDLKF